MPGLLILEFLHSQKTNMDSTDDGFQRGILLSTMGIFGVQVSFFGCVCVDSCIHPKQNKSRSFPIPFFGSKMGKPFISFKGVPYYFLLVYVCLNLCHSTPSEYLESPRFKMRKQ